jgi:hypothetical protein
VPSIDTDTGTGVASAPGKTAHPETAMPPVPVDLSQTPVAGVFADAT